MDAVLFPPFIICMEGGNIQYTFSIIHDKKVGNTLEKEKKHHEKLVFGTNQIYLKLFIVLAYEILVHLALL